MTMPQAREAEPIVFHAHVASEERDAAVRAGRAIGLRLLVLTVPLAWFELFPMRAWLELANGRPVSTAALVTLAGITLVLPLMMLVDAKRAVRSRAGTRYTLDDAAIRRSGDVWPWKLVRAFQLERDRRGRPERFKLVFNSGRTRAIRLPVDDDALVNRIVAFVAARVPSHDVATHGPIELPDALPRRAIGKLVIASLASVTLLAMFGRIERSDRETAVYLIFVGSALVPAVWYASVRRMLNVVQRGSAVVIAIVSAMTLLLAGLCIVNFPAARDAIRDLRAIPADVRERASQTISTRPSGSD